MTDRLRIVLIICILLYFCVVFRLLKTKCLTLKYSLLWLAIGCVMFCLVLFPVLLQRLSALFGIVETMNGLFTLAIGFIIILLLALTSIASKQTNKIKNLIQNEALLEKRIRTLEMAIEKQKERNGEE